MSWLVFGVSTRFLWALCNLVDQYIARYFHGEKSNGVGAAAMLQNLFVLPVIIVLIMFTGMPAMPDGRCLFWLALGAVTNAFALMPYLRALQVDGAHNTIPVFEITPVFVIALSWLVFGETMHWPNLAGAALIIGSGFLFLWDFKKREFKKQTLMLVLASAFFYALYQLCMRPASLRLNEWAVSIYFFTGIFLMGIAMAIVRRPWWTLMVATMWESRGRVVAATLVSNAFWCGSLLTLSLAMARAPGAGYVSALSGVQPIFVILLSWLAGMLGLPHFQRLSWTDDLKAKFLLLPVLLLGIYLLRR